jgi:hypothetical protein
MEMKKRNSAVTMCLLEVHCMDSPFEHQKSFGDELSEPPMNLGLAGQKLLGQTHPMQPVANSHTQYCRIPTFLRVKTL